MDRGITAIVVIVMLAVCVFIYAKMMRASIALLNRKVWNKPGVEQAWEPQQMEAFTISGTAMVARLGLAGVIWFAMVFFGGKQQGGNGAYLIRASQYAGEFALLVDAIVIYQGIGTTFLRALVISFVTWLVTVAIVVGSVLLVWLLVPPAREIFR